MLLILSTMISCNSVEPLRSYNASDPCSTTIEGKLTSGYEEDKLPKEKIKRSIVEKKFIENWSSEKPSLVILRVGKQPLKLSGEVLSVKEDGVLFDESKTSIAHDPDPKFYPEEDIYLFINEKGEKVIEPKIEQDWIDFGNVQFVMENTQNVKSSSVKFQAEVGKSFSYCIPPGSYMVKKIKPSYKSDDFLKETQKYNSKDTLNWHIDIKASHSNYFGDFYIDHSKIDSAKSFDIGMYYIDKYPHVPNNNSISFPSPAPPTFNYQNGVATKK